MQFYLSLAVLTVLLVAINAQIPGGLTLITEDKPNVKETKDIIVREMQEQAKQLPGAPSVELKDFEIREQVVAGILYHAKFNAKYTYASGEQVTKSCTAKVISPINSDKLSFLDSEDKIRCI